MQFDRFLVATLSISLLLFFCSPVQSTQLQGRADVQHSEDIGPLDAQLEKGNVFDPELHKIAPLADADWRLLPAWSAGTWVTTDYVIRVIQQFPSGETVEVNHPIKISNSEQTFGYQLDSDGNVWDCPAVRSVLMFEPDDELHYVHQGAADTWDLSTNPDRLITRGKSTEIILKRADLKIRETLRTEQIVERENVSDGVMKLKASMRVYLPNGKPFQNRLVTQEDHRTAPFKVMNEHNGLNIRESFEIFMAAHGLKPAARADN